MSECSIIWFRNNLRIHDNEVLFYGLENSDFVLPIYCLDPRQYEKLKITNFPKTGYFRCKFLLESLENLSLNLQHNDLNLYIENEFPEVVIKKLKNKFPEISTIYGQKEFASEEIEVEDQVHKVCNELGIELKLFDTNSLFKKEDLPFEVKTLPDVFTNFRNKVEKQSKVRKIVESNKSTNKLFPIDCWNEIPKVEALLDRKQIQKSPSKYAISFMGGENKGLERLNYYLWESNKVKSYKKTRNGLLGEDYSTKFSVWLANGCLSPVQVYWEIKKYEEENGANESTYWILFELLWREYFRLSAQKYGNKIFYKGGIQGYPGNEKQNVEVFEQWRLAQTNEDFVNANMQELLQTGFMSNRGRQNVASYLVHNFNIDWRMGAEWFESQLIDYDVYSNWGNWCYVAGVGHDPRSRKFNIERQASMYDPNRKYVNYWLDDKSQNATHQLNLNIEI